MKLSFRSRRRVVQSGAVIVLLIPLFFYPTIWFGTYISADFLGVALTDPLTALEILAAGRTVWWPLLVSVIPLVLVAALAGRVFCSFICPLNFLLELLPMKKEAKVRKKWWPIAGIFVVVLLSALVQIPIFTMLSPLHNLMRMFLFGLGIEFVFVVAVLLGAWFYGRKIWCQAICPLGALYGVMGIGRWIMIGFDEERCTHCGKCVQTCSMAVRPGSLTLLDKVSCTNCGDCIDVCEEKALYYAVCGKRKKRGDEAL
ncbi:4Fe-4S binding protein [Anaerosinus massiliensis]|uniref:4Fe-4S binding protein n=1 Tax=Massilibacillus massiliensis TaxID=1806837 RepID=UPI000DA6105B|nr:4Fe-4S binding protein [Massilibacillus massiliensis]